MKKIILLNTNMEWGGGEKWHLEAAYFLRKNDFEVEFICNPHSKLSHEARQARYKTHEINVSKLSFINPLKQNELSKLMRGAHAVIMNLPQDFKLGTLAAENAGVKRIVYRRGMPHPIKDKGINKKLFNKLTHVIANSKEVSESLIMHTEDWFPQDKIKLIYNGLELDRLAHSHQSYYRKKEGEIVIGNAARLVSQKGQKELLQVAKILKEKEFKFHLLIAGYGELENELKQLTAQYNLNDEVTFLGHVKDMPKFFNSIDYFAFPSHFEGCPNTLIEAMAYKKICFAYDVSSMPEVINYTNGHLSPLGDVQDMAYKIIHHSDANIAQNAYKTVQEKFNYQKNMQKLLDILD
ncbi:MAG: glycosyltransferase [Bacteriovoracaceae bacterium]|nr:glycosyltransferase [Bacteriovoracaceae bacterium]